jgi:hypothetical protein
MARCYGHGGELGAAVFANDGDRDAWVSRAANCGGGRCMVVGPQWVVMGSDQQVTARAALRLGGRIV